MTNVLAPYRVPLYALLAERYGVEVLCFGAGASYVPAWFGDLDRQLAAAPFPARRIAGPREALALGGRYDAAIAPVAGGAMLPATYLGMRRRGSRSCCGASVWAHPRGGAKAALGFPLVRHVYRHADAVVTYGEHVRRYVARYRGRDDDVVIAPQSVEAELFGRAGRRRRDRRLARRGRPPATARSSSTSAGWSRRRASRSCSSVALRSAAAPRSTAPPTPPHAHRSSSIGDGPLAAEVAATPGARLLGPLPRERLPVAYAAADALVAALDPDAALPRAVGARLQRGAPPGHARRRDDGGRRRRRRPRARRRDGPRRPARRSAGARRRDRAPARRPARCARASARAGRAALAGHTYAAMADAFGVALARAGALR